MENEFYKKVSAMREAQKQFFKTKDREWLQKSKSLEREVDGMIELIRRGQGELL